MMDDSELRVSFVGAKNKREQIGVLADLNVCPPREIAERLDAMRLLEPEGLRVEQFSARYSPPRKSYAKPLSPAEEQRAMELFGDGADDLAIAEALGVPVARVKAWRFSKRLLRPRNGAARGELWLNGAPVREIAGVRIRPCGDGMIVDVETEV